MPGVKLKMKTKPIIHPWEGTNQEVRGQAECIFMAALNPGKGRDVIGTKLGHTHRPMFSD